MTKNLEPKNYLGESQTSGLNLGQEYMFISNALKKDRTFLLRRYMTEFYDENLWGCSPR